MATTANHHSKPTAGVSSAMRNHQKSRFTAFVDSDDHDDHDGDDDTHHGGVMLRDFEDDSHTSGSFSTPIGTRSSSSSGNACATHPRKNPSTISFEKPAASGRRNTIAPIGTGRYSDHSANAHADAALDASVNAWVYANSQILTPYFLPRGVLIAD